jgi:hypothetical protein
MESEIQEKDLECCNTCKNLLCSKRHINPNWLNDVKQWHLEEQIKKMIGQTFYDKSIDKLMEDLTNEENLKVEIEKKEEKK